MLKFNPFKSITLMGALTAVGGYLLNHFDPNALGQNGAAIVQGIGAIVTVLGIRRRMEGPTPASPPAPAPTASRTGFPAGR